MSFSTFLHLDLNKMVAILQQSFSNAHYNDVIMGAIASQITSLTIVFSTVYSDADQRKYQSSASLAFVRGMHRGPVNSPHKWPVTRKMFPFDDVIMSFLKEYFVFIIIQISRNFVSKGLTVIIGSGNGLAPVRHQAITWTSDGQCPCRHMASVNHHELYSLFPWLYSRLHISCQMLSLSSSFCRDSRWSQVPIRPYLLH